MKKSRYSDEQIVRILREVDKAAIGEVAKRNGVSEASIYAWRKRFGEMVSDDVKRLKALVAEPDLEIEAMREIAGKNGERTGPTRSRAVCDFTRHQPATGVCAASGEPLGLALRVDHGGEECAAH